VAISRKVVTVADDVNEGGETGINVGTEDFGRRRRNLRK
jgi:hypothetical protein